MRILVVDDDYAHGAYVAALLDRYGHAVDTVTSGRAALHRLRTATYDAVIMDVFMPEMDGIELLREVKRDHPDVVVIGMSGSANGFHQGLEHLMTAMGARCLLHKPLNPAALCSALQKSS